MTELPYFWPLAMLGGLMFGILSGYEVAFVLAGIGIGAAVLADVPMLFLSIGVQRIFAGILTNWLLIAIPLFVFMGLMLERSGVAERLLRALAALFRGMPGGYGFAVAFLGVVMAAATGIIGASVVLIGTMALPAMRDNRYDMRVGSGLIAASGTLGILIPPSVMLIILGDQLSVSVGDLFMGAMLPGLVLAGLYLAYLLAIVVFEPQRMPAAPHRPSDNMRAALVTLLQDLILPVLLIFSVLGTIVAGIATPTESAAIGAVGATLMAAMGGGLSWRRLHETLAETTRTTAMIVFVMIGATIFSLIFRKLGGDGMITDLFALDDRSPYAGLLIVMGVVFVLGFFLEWVEISLVVVPIVAPVIAGLDFGLPRDQVLIWFAVALAVNLQTSFLTPPFGYALFYLRGIAPDLPIATIYRGIIPFVILQLIGLGLILLFPQIVLWLPRVLGE